MTKVFFFKLKIEKKILKTKGNYRLKNNKNKIKNFFNNHSFIFSIHKFLRNKLNEIILRGEKSRLNNHKKFKFRKFYSRDF